MSNKEWDKKSYLQTVEFIGLPPTQHELELTYEYGVEVGKKISDGVIRRLQDNLADANMRCIYLERKLTELKAQV